MRLCVLSASVSLDRKNALPLPASEESSPFLAGCQHFLCFLFSLCPTCSYSSHFGIVISEFIFLLKPLHPLPPNKKNSKKESPFHPLSMTFHLSVSFCFCSNGDQRHTSLPPCSASSQCWTLKKWDRAEFAVALDLSPDM